MPLPTPTHLEDNNRSRSLYLLLDCLIRFLAWEGSAGLSKEEESLFPSFYERYSFNEQEHSSVNRTIDFWSAARQLTRSEGSLDDIKVGPDFVMICNGYLPLKGGEIALVWYMTDTALAWCVTVAVPDFFIIIYLKKNCEDDSGKKSKHQKVGRHGKRFNQQREKQ